MNKRLNMINRLRRRGTVMLAAGALLALLGIALPGWIGDEVFNTRIVTGLGILLIGSRDFGLDSVPGAAKDTPEAARMFNAERDERPPDAAGEVREPGLLGDDGAGVCRVDVGLVRLEREPAEDERRGAVVVPGGAGCAAVRGLCDRAGDWGEEGVKVVLIKKETTQQLCYLDK